jgi:hypothetical protein
MHVTYYARSIYLDLISIIVRAYGVPADLSRRAIEVVGLRRLDCWDCGLESRRGHGGLTQVFVLCVVQISPCVGLMFRPEESYRVWCV